MKFFYHHQGQTLLEAIFAIGLLLIAVSAILGLAISNTAGQSASELQLVANNLAREGIEAVRNVRDSNWLADRAWDTGLVGDGTAVPKFDSTANSWVIDFTLDVPTTVFKSGGVYSQVVAGQLTIYSRLLTLKNICLATLDGTETIVAAGTTCGSGTIKIGLKIESQVNWSERGHSHTITLTDLLYAWKK